MFNLSNQWDFLLEVLTKVGVKGYLQEAGVTQKQQHYQKTTSTGMVMPKAVTPELSTELESSSTVQHLSSFLHFGCSVSMLPPPPATVFFLIHCWLGTPKNAASTCVPSATRHKTLCLHLLCLLRQLNCPFLPWENASIWIVCPNWEDMANNNMAIHSSCDYPHKTGPESSYSVF